MWQFVLKGKEEKGWSGGGGSADTGDAFLRYHCKLDTLRIFQSLIELCPASHWGERSSVFAVDSSAFQPKSFASVRRNGPKEHGASFLYDSAFFIAYLYNGFTVNLVGDRIATRLCRLLEIRISILLPFRSLWCTAYFDVENCVLLRLQMFMGTFGKISGSIINDIPFYVPWRLSYSSFAEDLRYWWRQPEY